LPQAEGSINSFNQASILSFSAAVSSFTNYYEGYFEKVHPKKKEKGGWDADFSPEGITPWGKFQENWVKRGNLY
jgi:hypothetical protein